MWGVIGIIVVAIGIVAYEAPILARKKLIKEIWVFSILLIFGVFISILNILRIDIPNPLNFLTNIYKPINNFISSITT